MEPRRLTKWAAIAEMVAAAVVVISPLLVAYSIKRNTDEMETSNSNFLYQLDEQVTGDLSREPQLASLFIKVEKGQALSDTGKFQYINLQRRYMTIWEIAWIQRNSGSLSEVDWQDWDLYLADYITGSPPEKILDRNQAELQTRVCRARGQAIRSKSASAVAQDDSLGGLPPFPASPHLIGRRPRSAVRAVSCDESLACRRSHMSVSSCLGEEILGCGFVCNILHSMV
jgi:hypothetical protein